ncbi:MAG: nucleotidyltransferase domain-containing protein [Cyclobacteriaceae bacterium]|nr:nucleotidyltransferase domain-containing protein [Cyclobacteriaceae bacterium]
MMDIGLSNRDKQTILSILVDFPSISKVFIFGSRAKGNFGSGSDIDLAIMDEHISMKDLFQLRSKLEDSNLPYFVDIVHYPSIKSQQLKNHINRVGKIFYQMAQ